MPGTSTARQKRLVGFIAVLAIVNVAYRLVYATGLQRTAALFIGIPAVLAIGLALLPASRSATGAMLKRVTIAVLLAAVLLPEGLLCILFALPLVVMVALVVGIPLDIWRHEQRRRHGPRLMGVAVPLIVLSLEGVLGSPFDPHDSATASMTVEATPDQVAAALATTPNFDADVPTFARLGFNHPVNATGEGIAVGDERTIDFTGGTHDDHPLRLFGLTGERSVDHHAQMHLTVVESQPGRVVFAVDHDMTMLSRWITLDRAVVTWARVDGDPGRTRVEWRLEYERLVYPSAYFGPLAQYGMDQAAGYLLHAVIDDPLR
jgi:hypothetical protein